jgi:hypothetical protein
MSSSGNLIFSKSSASNLLFQINNSLLDAEKINISMSVAVGIVNDIVNYAKQNDMSINEDDVADISSNFLKNNRHLFKNVDEIEYMVITLLSINIAETTMDPKLRC